MALTTEIQKSGCSQNIKCALFFTFGDLKTKSIWKCYKKVRNGINLLKSQDPSWVKEQTKFSILALLTTSFNLKRNIYEIYKKHWK